MSSTFNREHILKQLDAEVAYAFLKSGDTPGGKHMGYVKNKHNGRIIATAEGESKDDAINKALREAAEAAGAEVAPVSEATKVESRLKSLERRADDADSLSVRIGDLEELVESLRKQIVNQPVTVPEDRAPRPSDPTPPADPPPPTDGTLDIAPAADKPRRGRPPRVPAAV